MSIWKTIKAFFSNKDSVISVTESPTIITNVPVKVTPEMVDETFNNMMADAKIQADKQKKKRPYKKSNKTSSKKSTTSKPTKSTNKDK